VKKRRAELGPARRGCTLLKRATHGKKVLSSRQGKEAHVDPIDRIREWDGDGDEGRVDEWEERL
jgi:hypothetical protein